jgi:hypothetical protein
MVHNISPWVATDWLFLSVMLCAFAWVAGRKLAAILLPVCVGVAAFCVFLPLGKPIPFAPAQGQYTVLGAKIVPNVAIWVLLDDGKNEPTYYRLPYSNEAANQLQAAQDGAQGTGQGPHVKIGGDGGAEYDGPPPVTGEPPKTPETPAISIP